MTYCKVVWMSGLVEYYPNDCGEGQNKYNAYYKEFHSIMDLRRTKKVSYIPEGAKIVRMVKHKKGWREE